MRRRVHRASKVVLSVRRVDASRMVTLEDPSGEAEPARQAFARLKPPEGTTPDQVAAWRNVVAAVARAVRVVPGPQAALVPVSSERPGVTVGTIRQEALELARETGDPQIEALTETILDRVGA